MAEINYAIPRVAIINLGKKNDSISKKAFKLYDELLKNNFEVIIDDTENNPSNKFKILT